MKSILLLFERAFGKNLEEFHEILLMPEEYIVYRQCFENNGFTETWRNAFRDLSPENRAFAEEIIYSNDFRELTSKTTDENILAVLGHYLIRKTVKVQQFRNDPIFKKAKKETARLIKRDIGINLTITYDFEMETARRKHIAKVS